MGRQITDQALTQAIADGKFIELRGYNLSGGLQHNLERVLRAILSSYRREELFPVLFSVVQELALWASLANMRQIYFEQNDLDLADEYDLEKSEKSFQESLKPQKAVQYARHIRDRGLFLILRIEHSHSGVRFEILNNAIHSVPLEDRLRKLLRQAMSYTDIMDYFKDHPGDPEGRQVGFAYAILMLKDAGLRPELMRLGQSGDANISRLEIPFDASFASIRDRILNDEKITPFDSHQSLFPDQIKPAKIDTVICPVCGELVDDRVFFSFLTPGMLKEEEVVKIKPEWRLDDGACASCIATHG